MLTISAASATNVAATVAALPIHCGISSLPYIHPAPRRAGLRQLEEPLAVPDPADAQAVMQPDQSDPPSEAFGPVQTLGGDMAPVPGNRIPAKAGSLTDPNRLRRGSRTAVAKPSLAPRGDDAGSSRCRTRLDQEIVSSRRLSASAASIQLLHALLGRYQRDGAMRGNHQRWRGLRGYICAECSFKPLPFPSADHASGPDGW